MFQAPANGYVKKTAAGEQATELRCGRYLGQAVLRRGERDAELRGQRGWWSGNIYRVIVTEF